MKYIRPATALASLALLALPLSAFAQVYYYAPGTVSGAYNYNSYIPAAAMPYVNMGYQMQQQQQQQQYQGYSYQSQYQSQSQSQYQSSPSYSYGYNSYPSYGYTNMPAYGYSTAYSSHPQSYSYPSGTTAFGQQLCYWSDYPTYAPCSYDPQQWIQDPYTGQWY